MGCGDSWKGVDPSFTARGHMGACGDVLARMRTYGGLQMPMGTHGDLWVPTGTSGDQWRRTGANGRLGGPMGFL